MFTLYALPKAFKGHNGIIQRNAITSWTQLEPRPEIVLFGDDEGTAEICAELGLRHIPEIVRNATGTPLVDALFRDIESVVSTPWLCYVNSDIILLPDFLEAFSKVQSQLTRFLLICERFDLDVTEPLDFDSPTWREELRARVARDGRPSGLAATDLFLYPAGLYAAMPELAIGRMWWDNWLIYEGRHQGVPVIDATPVVMAVHQNHDYAHVVGATAKDSARDITRGEECMANLRKCPPGIQNCNNLDASHLLTPSGLVRARSLVHLRHRSASGALFHPRLALLFKLVEACFLPTRALRAVLRRRRVA